MQYPKAYLARTRCALAAALACCASAFAQTPAATLERVTVTGSTIKRLDRESAQPLQVLRREDIAAIGANSIGQLLDTLTTNDRTAISDLGGANSWASGASSISLRNLGVGGTLVLVNGRRISPFGFADGLQLSFTNIDTIPSQFIERVEILKEGASAIYGSEAIGGVINVIMRRDFSGAQANLSGTASLRSSSINKEHMASVSIGHGSLTEQGYNAYAHVELFQRDNYKDREIRKLLPDWYLKYAPDRNDRSSGSFPGNYVGRYPAVYPQNPALAGQRISQAAPGCAPENLSGGLCFYDYWKDSDAMPATERITLLTGGRLRLGQETTAFVEFHGADVRPRYRTSVPRSNITGNALTWYDSIKGELQRFVDPQLPVGHPNNPFSFPIGLNYRFADDPEMFQNVSRNLQYRLLGGVESKWGGWDVDAAFGVMSSNATQRQRLYRDRFGYTEAITSGEYKFGQSNPRSVLDKMFPEMGSHGTFRQQFADLRLSGEAMQMPAGPLLVAMGAELRRESMVHRSSDNVLAARIVQFSGVSISGERDMAALFAEAELPLHRTLKASLALRGDKVLDGFGAVTPKLSLAWRPRNDLLVRGTATQGFRAPSLPETGNGGASWFNSGYEDPKRCATATAMFNILDKGNAADKDLARAARASGCNISFPARVLPNPDLKPEHSNSLSGGMVFQATRDISLALDYYRIERKDEISTRDPGDALEREDDLPGLVERQALTPQDFEFARRVLELSGQNLAFAVGPVGTIAAQYRNQNRTKVSGVDLDLQTRWSLGDWGRLNAGLEANYQIDYRDWDSEANRFSGTYVGYRSVPRVRAIAKLGWQRGPWSLGARINHTASTKLAWGEDDSWDYATYCADRGMGEECLNIAATTVTNLSLSYSGFKNIRVGAHLFNAFNEQAPVRMASGRLPLWGRVGRVELEFKF
ncbi:MAG: TonB-dependent receptor [Burkholderiales bacterium]|nr:TonB-dependent receptor [Burkholderiales bacterium]